MAFEFSTHMADVSNQLWAVTSAVGAVACFIVLLVSAVVYTHRASRSHLDRVSFRLVIYALVANMVFGIASAVGGSMTGPGTSCSASIFFLQLTLEISCLLLFCVALNLQLVVVHGIHATKLERYYIGVSVLFGLALTVPPLAAGQYGWDPLVKDCWYTNDNQAQRLAWQIGTQLFWTGLTSVGEVIAATSVLIFMLRVHLRQKHAFVSSHQSSVSRWRFWTSTDSKKSSRTSAPSVIHANAYKTVILRIALYPMASCIINLTSIACVVHATSTNGIQSSHDYSILLLSDFLYGGRAVIYAILAATDPALVRGVRSFLAHHLGRCDPYPTTTTMTGTTMTRTRKDRLAVHVELTTISASSYRSTNNDAKQSLEAHEIEMSKHDPLLADSIAERGLVLDKTVASDLMAEDIHLAVPQSTGISVWRSHDLQNRFEKEEQEREEFRRML